MRSILDQTLAKSPSESPSAPLTVICTKNGAIIPEALRVALKRSTVSNLNGFKKVLLSANALEALRRITTACFQPGCGTPFKSMFPALSRGIGVPMPDNMTCGRAVLHVSKCAHVVKCFFEDVIGNVVVDVFRDLECYNAMCVYEVIDASILLAADRANRSPIMSTETRRSVLYETLTIVVPLYNGVFIGLWDEAISSRKLEGIDLVCPLLSTSSAYVFSCIPFCFLPPKPVDRNVHSFASIVINLRHVKAPKETRSSLYNFGPESWLAKSSGVPGILPCAICRAPIRERSFQNLMGDKHNLERVTGGGAHCIDCKGMGAPFLVCEVCVKLRPRPVAPSKGNVFNAVDRNQSAEYMYGFLFHLDSSVTRTLYSRCTHSNVLLNNDVEDVLFAILQPRELQATARVFMDFTLRGTWIKSFAPNEVLKADRKLMWQEWMNVFLRNSSCSRVRMSFFALQFALDFAGMFFIGGPEKRSRLLKRELYFDDADFSNPKAKAAIEHRLKIAQDIAHGLFDKQVLKRMALRVFRYLQESEWGQTAQCSCALVLKSEASTLTPSSHSMCSGPILELSADPGCDDNVKWGLLSERGVRARSALREYQRFLDDLMTRRVCNFDPNRHYDVTVHMY